MGYHRKLYSVYKKDLKKFNLFYNKELEDEGDNDLIERFGKISHYEFELSDFLNFDKLTKIQSDMGDVYQISEINLLNIIEQYCEFEKKYYSDILEEKDEKYQHHRMKEYFKNKEFHFGHWKDNICLDKQKEKLTNNWRFEYDLLDIIRIYKTFDFDNKLLICVGS